MHTYWMLCEAVQKANIFYGEQPLATFLSSFVHTTIALYYFLFFVINGYAMAAIFGGAWVIAQVAHPVLLTRPSTLVTELADETAAMICKLINTDLDPTMVELLEGILMQLRKHNARFTALGFFQIHNSTVTAMAGAVTTYLVTFSLSIWCQAVVFFSCSLKYQRFLNILGILKKVDRSLQQDVSDHKAKVKVFFVCIVIVLLILSNSVLACTAPLREGNITSLCYTPTHIMYFAQAALFLHFTQVAQSVAARFRTINASIKEELVRNGHEQLLRRYLPRVRASQSTRDLSSTCKLKSLMDSYWLLCEAVQQTNIFYGDQLIATFLSSFLHVTITLYYFFFFITYGLTMPAIIVGAWIIAHVAHLVLLTRPSTIMTEVADETASVICKLMNMDLDPPLVELLEEALLLLRKHNARFSAQGFFRIHNSTLTGMAGAMTTYVVVLIQFLALKD
ncbi:gustatory and pheromone receptor 32a-like [Homalodisca vitripennis]|uniref:gustatory and pheromone receptor 32a-like n=1 Tax=Homalodisca vitripennis TaxID=197043 RepID=UPI001EECAA1D|nr:gustatory and pheromone receptor 32a-like [Homalodisca vitripennis]